MAVIDPSYFEMIRLIFKPLTEDFEPPWSIFRSIFWGILPIALMSTVTGLVLDPTHEYIRAKGFFLNLAVISGTLSGLIYVACAWQAYQVHIQRENQKTERVKKFRD